MIEPKVGQVWAISHNPNTKNPYRRPQMVNVFAVSSDFGRCVIATAGLSFSETVTFEWLEDFGVLVQDQSTTMEVKDFDKEILNG
jgi:hypothetical protein